MALDKKKSYINLNKYLPAFKKVDFENMLLDLDTRINNVEAGILAPGSVSTEEIADGAITEDKLTSAFKTRVSDIETDVATNTTDIATNASNIATNTSDIGTNATDIANLSKIHRILHVETTGIDATATGSASQPFLTIQAAIDYAKTMTPTPAEDNGVAIIVGPGKFTGKVTLAHRGIHLYGFGQGVTQIHNNGTAVEILDNGVDPVVRDLKIVGISIKSTNAAEYSLVVQGVAGSNLAGNELQLRDCRVEGTKAIYVNLANYINYQNTYMMGTQLYEQVSGVWIEDSESTAVITNDFDSTGDKPSDTGHYGINFVRHLPRAVPVLLNDGIIGEDYRPQDYTKKEIWVSGITGNRPTSPVVGERYFDTTLGIPIWFDGTNWIDATGTTV